MNKCCKKCCPCCRKVTSFFRKAVLPLRNRWVVFWIFFELVYTALAVAAQQNNWFDVKFTNVFGNAFTVLSATLGFLLPLLINSAIEKNKEIVKLYNALCGDVLALAYECVSLLTEAELQEGGKDFPNLRNLFGVLCNLPEVVWIMNSKISEEDKETRFKKLKGINNKELELELEEIEKIILFKEKVEEGGENDDKSLKYNDLFVLKVIDYINEYAAYNYNVEREFLQTWAKVYSSYGDLATLASYKKPRVLIGVVQVALVFWALILPFSQTGKDKDENPVLVIDDGYWALLTVFFLSYFYIGLNLAGSKVGNAFAEETDDFAYQTVNDTRKLSKKAVKAIYANRLLIVARYSERQLKRADTLLVEESTDATIAQTPERNFSRRISEKNALDKITRQKRENQEEKVPASRGRRRRLGPPPPLLRFV